MKAPMLNDRPRPSRSACWVDPAYLSKVADWAALHDLNPHDVPISALTWDDTTVRYRLFVRDEHGRKRFVSDLEARMTEWRTTVLLAPFPQPEEAL